MEFIRRNSRFLFVLILPVYFYIVQNSIQNKHTHVYANGIVVTHSHPFDKDGEKPINEHEHSKREICLYSCLHFDFYEAPVLTELNVILNETHKNYLVEDYQVVSLPLFLKTVPRGPPV